MSGAGTESYGDLLVTSVVVLAVVCVAAFVIVRIAGRWLTTGRSKGAQLLDVIARLPLEPRRSLYVVAVGGKTLLVGTSEMGMSLLTELDGHEVHARTPERTSFADLVKSAWSRRRGLHVTDPASAPAAADALTPRYGAAAATGGAGVGNAAVAASAAQGPELAAVGGGAGTAPRAPVVVVPVAASRASGPTEAGVASAASAGPREDGSS